MNQVTSKFQLPKVKKSTFKCEIKVKKLTIWCSLCGFRKEVDLDQAGSVKKHMDEFKNQHDKRKVIKCEGKA